MGSWEMEGVLWGGQGSWAGIWLPHQILCHPASHPSWFSGSWEYIPRIQLNSFELEPIGPWFCCPSSLTTAKMM